MNRTGGVAPTGEEDRCARRARQGRLHVDELAASVAAALRRRYDQIRLATVRFQQAALRSEPADGVYGPVTRAALSYWLGRPAPRPWVGSALRLYRYRWAFINAVTGDLPEAQAFVFSPPPEAPFAIVAPA